GHVRGVEVALDLVSVVYPLSDGRRSLAEYIAYGVALGPLADAVRSPVVFPDVADDQDVGMVERSCRQGFLFESGESRVVVRHRRGQDLDRDLALQARVLSGIDLTHAALTQLVEDAVWTELPPDHLNEFVQVIAGLSLPTSGVEDGPRALPPFT